MTGSDLPIPEDAALPSRLDSAARSIYNDLCSARGGESSMTPAEIVLARRAAFVAAWCIEAERRWIAGETRSRKDVETYLAAVRTLSSVLKQLGIESKPRTVGDDVLRRAWRDVVVEK